MAPRTKQIAVPEPSPALLTFKIMQLHEDALIPKEGTTGSVGLDLASLYSLEILPSSSIMAAYRVRTGIAVEIPEGYHGKIFLRSSIGEKTKLRLANGTGIIDSDYRGELILLVENIGRFSEYIQTGQRIAQLIIEKNTDLPLEIVETLSETERGSAGIGSTGK